MMKGERKAVFIVGEIEIWGNIDSDVGIHVGPIKDVSSSIAKKKKIAVV